MSGKRRHHRAGYRRWVLLSGRNTGSVNAPARVYLALSRNGSVAPPFAAMVRGFDATRRGWFLDALEDYAHGRWTGEHADAALYPAVVEKRWILRTTPTAPR
ncbi:MAG TPA: hypothetical protein VD978_01660 [Azospirillum sp.]|nr:hypothetical protein [Azospirillum sp.]